MNPDWQHEMGEPPPTANRGSVTKVILLVVGVIIGGGVLSIGCCVGLFFLGARFIGDARRDASAATAASDEFFDDLRLNRIEEAYKKTSAAFQRELTVERLAEFVARFEILKTHTSRTYNNFHLFKGTGGKRVTLKAVLHTENNALSCTLVMVEQDDKWVIERLNVP